MTKKRARVWVDPSFKKILKGMAVDKDMSIVDLTKELSGEPSLFEKIKNEKKKGFNFKFP